MRIAEDYFEYLGRHLPQQCASDEFYLLPRSEAAVDHMDRLDDISGDMIQDHIRHVKGLLRRLEREGAAEGDEGTDLGLLKRSMEGFIFLFEQIRPYQKDPTLYIKIPLLAVDHILSNPRLSPEIARPYLLKILSQIPGFISLAKDNLDAPSAVSVRLGIEMAGDAIRFHSKDIAPFIVQRLEADTLLLEKNTEAMRAWDLYRETLGSITAARASAGANRHLLCDLIRLLADDSRGPEELVELLRSEYVNTERRLRLEAGRIDPRKSWKEILHEGFPEVCGPAGLLALYREEIERLRGFLLSGNILSIPSDEEVRIVETPAFLRSLRATASYKAPLTGSGDQPGVFYLTPPRRDLGTIACHAPYLCAHETYPGHHLLDYIRIHHPNPVRRQIELPSFYEGWACYSELLLDELGYVREPRQQLVGLKRRLWRILRAIIDLELQIGSMNLGQAARKAAEMGFSLRRAMRRVHRFLMEPGYQLCYVMGMNSILGLRACFGGIGLRSFHDTLLREGQIPFQLAKKAIERADHGDR